MSLWKLHATSLFFLPVGVCPRVSVKPGQGGSDADGLDARDSQ